MHIDVRHLLPCGQYGVGSGYFAHVGLNTPSHFLNRHLLPCGQYGVGYAIALWAIRSAGAAMCSPLSRLARIRRAHFGLNRSPKSVCFLSDILRILKPI